MSGPAVDLTIERRLLIDGVPPEWAGEWGQDRFGLFVGFVVEKVSQRLRWIPPGSFTMGSREPEVGHLRNEGPQHEVKVVQGFWMFETPCTQELWAVVMGGAPSRFQTSDRPVEGVSWIDVKQFIARINDLIPGLSLSLPSEAQWEYACRAGTEASTYAGDLVIWDENAPALDRIAWYGGNSDKHYDLEEGADSSSWPAMIVARTKTGTRRVKLKEPNAWGLYDMLGNVWEWVEDPYHSDYVGAPDDGSVWRDTKAARRVLRGGSWHNYVQSVRSASRLASAPDARNDVIGFRCVRVQS